MNYNARKNLTHARMRYNNEYVRWSSWGSREADDKYNDAVIEFIKAYKKAYPAAVGYKAHEGIVEITGKIYNFHCDMVFDGSAENIAKVNEAIKAGKSANDILDIIEGMDGEYIIFS